MEAEYIRVGGTDFHIGEHRDMKKADFIKKYRGTLTVDIEDAYYLVTGKNRPTKKEAETPES